MQDQDDAILAQLIGEFLDQRNAGKSPDLASLLSRCPQSKHSELEEAIGFVATADAAQPAAAAAAKKFGDFELIRELGRGGMGVVYEARQISVDRRVALKILSPWVGGEETARARLDREAQALAKLRHPGIVTVFATGEHEGTRYFVMDLVPGKTLDQILADAKSKGARVSTKQSLGWMREIAEALAYAHRAGIVHRDVKPSNIRITSEGKAMLLDFGLARDAAKDTLTMTGAFQGSPFYAPPEQIRGNRAQIDARADVYSLGVTIYECVAGCLPFQGETAEQIFRQVLETDPVKPRFWNPTISADLETIVVRAIDKDPERRYASAGELAEDLRRCREDLPILARPDTLLYRAHKLARRRSSALIAASALLVAGSLGWTSLRHYASVAERHASRIKELEGAMSAGSSQPSAAQDLPSGGDLPSRSQRALALFEAKTLDCENGRFDEARKKLLEIVSLVESGVDPKIFPASNQVQSYYTLASPLIGKGSPLDVESYLLKAVETFDRQPKHGAAWMDLAEKQMGSVFNSLEALYRKSLQAEKESFYRARRESLANSSKLDRDDEISRGREAKKLFDLAGADFDALRPGDAIEKMKSVDVLMDSGVDPASFSLL